MKEFSASHGLWHDTLNSLGIETNPHPLAGSNIGVWTTICNVDPNSVQRSYAGPAYLLSSVARPNLKVITEATATEVIIDRDEQLWVAKGIRFRHGDKIYSAYAKNEVILCAGSVQSPQLLELSGIGNPGILSAAGITVKVPNNNVGENLQDHISAYSNPAVLRLLTEDYCSGYRRI
jgi:choline dehydrogenase-like flavoprotein